MLVKLCRSVGRFDHFILAGMTNAGVRAGAAVKFDAATSLGEFAVAGDVDAAGAIARDGVTDSDDACGSRMH